jgi:hypothetical protein
VRNKKLAAALAPPLWAAAALLLTVSVVAEIAAAPTAREGVSSSTWTPVTAVTALFFGQGALHGSFDLPSIFFGLAIVVLASLLAGSLAAAFVVYCLGWGPPPAAAALLGAACGLATQILLVNLLCNWLQSDNGIYDSAPNWSWFVAWGAWGIALGLGLSRRGRRISPSQGDFAPPRHHRAAEGSGVGVSGPSPLLSGDPYPGPLPEPRR